MKSKAHLPLAFLSLAVPALAQDFLDPLVVTATRSSMRADEVPYSVSVLDAEDLENNSRRTLPDELKYVPGVLVQKTAHGHGSPFIRGFTGRQNLLMIDGVRINNSTYRSGPVQYWNTVDALSIGRLELIRSQGSVLYGSDAIGGTVNTFTKFSDYNARPDGQAYHNGSLFYEYRTNGEGSHTGRLEAEGGVGGKFGFWLGLSGKDFGDIKDSAVGLMKNTGYTEQDVDFRFDMKLTERVDLTVAYQYVNQDNVWRWHRTQFNPGWTHDDHVVAGNGTPGFPNYLTEIYDQERSLAYIKLTGENPEESAFIRRWHTTLSWQKTQDSTDNLRRVVPTLDYRTGKIDLNTFGLDVGFESEIGSGTLVYGFDYYHDEVDSEAFRNGAPRPDARPVADGSTYQLLGVYSQYEWRPTDPLTIIGGLRYTYAQAEWDAYRPPGAPADLSGEGDWDDFSASLRALWDVDENWAIFGGVSQAFRAPNLDDLTGSTVSAIGLNSRGSPDLDPEKYVTAELGTRFSNETFSGSLAAFYTWSRDAIIGQVVGPDTFATNGGEGYVYGFEAEGLWKINRCWALTGMMGWNEGKVESPTAGEKWISRQLPFTGSLALRWTHPNERVWVEGRLYGAVTEDRVDSADQANDNSRIPTNGTPGYLVASLRAGWQATDNLQLTAALENIADDDYRNHGSGQNEPGFGAIVGAKYSW